MHIFNLINAGPLGFDVLVSRYEDSCDYVMEEDWHLSSIAEMIGYMQSKMKDK